MGGGIAQAAAYSGYEVILKDIDQAALDKGMVGIKALFDGLVAKRKLSQAEADTKYGAIKATTNYADMANCDLVIEAVVEKMVVKKAVLAELEKVISKPFVFASNTSSLSVDEMALAARTPANVVGLHFFNPVHKMKLIEVVRAKDSSNETVALAQAFGMRLGKTTVVTNDGPGFVVNRVLSPYMKEAFTLLLDGVIETITAAKLLGKKGGKGLYLYDPKTGRRAGINPDIQAAITAKPKVMTMGAIQDRLFLPMVNEAALCLQEGIISDPSQLDLAMIFGTGFAPFLGGVLGYADQVGMRTILQKLQYLSQVAGDNYKPAQLIVDKARKGESFYK